MTPILCIALLGLFEFVSSEIPIEINRNDVISFTESRDNNISYRVPEDVDPIHFEVEITPYFDTAPEGKSTFSFDGLVTINMKVIKDDLSAIYIQENVREIEEVTLKTENGILVELDRNNPYERIRSHHFLKINLADGTKLVNGEEYVLVIRYIGNINETPLQRGVFRGHYKDAEGTVHWYAATHLQPVNSRQAFPSFDEPGFKSTFDIIINRPANFGETYSNMPLKQSIENEESGRVKEIFHRTPKMSAYLVTFHISEAFTVIAENNDQNRPYRILARPTAQGQGAYALEVGPPVTKWLEDYFGIEYYSMNENMKNDQIASAYWASGATENWGLVTYRELRLLYQEGETNAVDKMSIGTITAHELAHKWFGNLITARWWDNVWINEGFASYFEYFAMDGVDKTMELEHQFNIMYVQSALSADASPSTRALEHTVNSPAQVTSHFSGISYSKGAALLLMTKHFIGEPAFMNALTSFLKDRSYKEAFPIHLYEAFGKSVDGRTDITSDQVEKYFKYWVEEPGYPVITVQVHSDRITVDQERFFVTPTETKSEQLWPLPLTYTTGSNPDFTKLEHSHYMTGEQYTITNSEIKQGEEWVIFNLQQKGLYRVNYDTTTWKLIANQLNKDITVIHTLNRAQIVDDVFALMRSQKLSYELGFEVLEFLKKDTSYYSWYPAISGFNWLRNRFLHLPEALAKFDDILLEYLEIVVDNLGFDVTEGEALTRTLNRFYVLSFACNTLRHEGCVKNAVEKFSALRASGTSVNPNIRRHVFCQGVLAGGYQEWKFLFDRRQASNNQADETVMLRALGCTTDDQARQEYLKMILDEDIVKAQDTVNAFTFLMMGHRSNANVVLEFLKQNYEAIREATVLQSWFESVISTVAAYLDKEGLDNMEAWLQANKDTIPEYSVGIASVNAARAVQAWGDANSDIVLAAAAKDSATVALPTAMLLFTTCLAVLLR